MGPGRRLARAAWRKLVGERDDYGPAWQDRRREFLASYGRECASCHDPDPAEVHVHHLLNPPRILRRVWPMHAVPDSWLVVLCADCHRRIPTGRARWGWSHVALTTATFTWDDWPRWWLRRLANDRGARLVAAVLAALVVAALLFT